MQDTNITEKEQELLVVWLQLKEKVKQAQKTINGD